jgi:N utilization substance protein B
MARQRAVQALYMWQMSGNDLADIDQQIMQDQNMNKVDLEYFRELLHKIPVHVEELGIQLAPYLNRSLNELDPVELAVLRVATYELLHRPDVPYRVVINEAVNQAKTFGASDSHKFVNGVLDELAKKLRAVEVKAKQRTTK